MDTPIPLTAKLTPHTFALKFFCSLTPIHHLPPPHILRGTGRSLCPSCFPTIFSATRLSYKVPSLLLILLSLTSKQASLSALRSSLFSTNRSNDHPDRLLRNGAATLDNLKQQFLCRLRTPPSSHYSSSPELATVQKHWLQSSNVQGRIYSRSMLVPYIF